MKKVLCLVLVVTILAQFGVLSSASYVYDVEGKDFTVELPDDFDEVEDMKFIGDDGSNFSVSVREYTEDDEDYCIDKMTDEEIKKRGQTFADLSSLAFASVNREGHFEVISAEKVQHKNGYVAFVMSLKTSAKNKDGETVRYQKVYEFTCKEHIYTFVYTSCEDGSLDAMDESFNSIVIREDEKIGTFGTFVKKIGPVFLKKGLPVIVLVGIILLGIIRFIRTPEKRKKGKL